MKLKEIGRYLELPIVGLKIKEIVFNGMPRLIFDDEEGSSLDIHSNFKVVHYNQTQNINPREKEALLFFFDHFGKTVKTAKADKVGNLWIAFDDGAEVIVEDGPYENWHYTKLNQTNTHDNLFIHGGVGRTVCIES